MDSKSVELALTLDNIYKEIEWISYLECQYLPNTKIEKDVCSYLENWNEEEFDSVENPDLELIFKEFPNAEKVISCLKRSSYS
jgi:hypothetical protein